MIPARRETNNVSLTIAAAYCFEFSDHDIVRENCVVAQ